MEPSQHTNIELFQKGKKYTYAIAKNVGGPPLLKGKAYSSKKARNNGIQNLIKNLDRLEIQEQEKKYFFTIKSGNNQLLAKSVFFTSDQEMHEAIDFINNLFTVEKIDSIDEPPKYSFKLKFYIPDSEGPLRGRIEYPFKKEKKVFNGIDIQTIERFLRNYLPQEEKEKLDKLPVKKEKRVSPAAVLTNTTIVEQTISETPAAMLQVGSPIAVKKEVSIKPSATKPDVKHSRVIVPNTNTIHFDFINWETKEKNNLNLNTTSKAGIQVDLSSVAFSKEIYTDLMISLSSATFGINRKALLGRQLAKTDDLRQISIPIDLHAIPSPGLYKFELLIKFMTQEGSTPPFYLIGTKMAILN